MSDSIPAFLSHLNEKVARFQRENPSATERAVALAIVDDVDRLAVATFEAAES